VVTLGRTVGSDNLDLARGEPEADIKLIKETALANNPVLTDSRGGDLG